MASITDLLVPHKQGRLLFTRQYERFPDRKFYVVETDDDECVEENCVLVYGEEHALGPRIVLVDSNFSEWWVNFAYDGIEQPPMHIKHAKWLTDVDKKIFSDRDFQIWRRFAKNKMVVGARLADNSVVFLTWPIPTEDEDGVEIYLNGKLEQSPFVC